MSAAAESTGTLDQALAQGRRLLAEAPALAIEQARAILEAVPGQRDARCLLAAGLAATGDVAQALAELEALTREQPRWAVAPLELGLLYGRLGRGEDALAALRRAVALAPDQPRAWRALGDHLAAGGDADGAALAYANHVRHSTRDPELMAAAAALAENRLPEAESRLRARLRAAPTDVAALRMLAEVGARLGRHEDAEALLARCLELAPGFDAARQNYALVLYRANKPEQALIEVATLRARDPRNPSLRNLEAVIHGRTGDYARAAALYEELLREYPNNPRLWLSQGHTLKTAGRAAEAIAAYRRCIALDPAFGEAWWSLANLKTVRFAPEDVAAMQAQLARADLDPAQRIEFAFALGKALEDEGQWEAAFRSYADGNALRRARVPYDADHFTGRIRRACELFTPAFFAERAGWGVADADPIFVVGLPRSGSTLIEQILSSHSAVEGTMELPEIISITRALRRRAGAGGGATYYDALAELGPEEVRAIGAQYLERTRIQRKTGAPRFIDKMPNNFVHAGLIHLALPNARIVDARRHPLACGFSCFKQHFARGQNFTYDLADLGRYYADYVAWMAHVDAVLPGRVHRVIYERMVADTEAEVRRLLDYCGLPFEAGCLRFFENERPVRTASAEQVRRPIYREGLDHWRHFEPWLGPLVEALGPVLTHYPQPPP